jgi:hypothetical protein
MIEVLVGLMWIFIILLGFIFIGDEIKKILSQISTAKIGDLEIQLIKDVLNPYEHMFFYNIKKYLKYEDNYPTCNIDAKNKMLINMLRIKLECWYKNYFDFFSSHKTIDSSSMNEVIKKIVDEYERKWQEAKIPQYVIDEFNKKHTNKVDYMSAEMKYLFKNHSQSTNDKFFIHIFLNRSLILLDDTFIDMRKTFKKVVLDKKEENYDYIYPQYIP